MVAEYTVAEQDTLARARERQTKREEHMRAALAQWFLLRLYDLIPWCMAIGYRRGKAQTSAGRYERIEPLDIKRLLDKTPGLIKRRKRNG